jgi:hypothetical protein
MLIRRAFRLALFKDETASNPETRHALDFDPLCPAWPDPCHGGSGQ